MFLSIDIGGTALKYALFDGEEMKEKGELLSAGSLGPEVLVENLCKIIDQYNDLDAIGIDTAGLVNSSAGVICSAGNLKIHSDFPLVARLKEKYDLPIYLENDVNAAALGEAFYGSCKDNPSFLFLAYGTGIGGGIVINRQIFDGNDGFGGEMGHLILHPAGRHCGCGCDGCYEQYASTTALVAAAKEVDPTVTNGRILFEKFAAGDKAMKDIIDHWVGEVVLGLISLVHIFNPSAILLGGGIMNESYLVSQVEEKLMKIIMPSYRAVQVKHAALGNYAGVYGMLARHMSEQK